MKVRFNLHMGQCTPEYFELRGTSDLVFLVNEDTNTDIAIVIGPENAKFLAMAVGKFNAYIDNLALNMLSEDHPFWYEDDEHDPHQLKMEYREKALKAAEAKYDEKSF